MADIDAAVKVLRELSKACREMTEPGVWSPVAPSDVLRARADAIDAVLAALGTEQREKWAAQQDKQHWRERAEQAESLLADAQPERNTYIEALLADTQRERNIYIEAYGAAIKREEKLRAALEEARREIQRLTFVVNDRQERGNELLARVERAEQEAARLGAALEKIAKPCLDDDCSCCKYDSKIARAALSPEPEVGCDCDGTMCPECANPYDAGVPRG